MTILNFKLSWVVKWKQKNRRGLFWVRSGLLQFKRSQSEMVHFSIDQIVIFYTEMLASCFPFQLFVKSESISGSSINIKKNFFSILEMKATEMEMMEIPSKMKLFRQTNSKKKNPSRKILLLTMTTVTILIGAQILMRNQGEEDFF